MKAWAAHPTHGVGKYSSPWLTIACRKCLYGSEIGSGFEGLGEWAAHPTQSLGKYSSPWLTIECRKCLLGSEIRSEFEGLGGKPPLKYIGKYPFQRSLLFVLGKYSISRSMLFFLFDFALINPQMSPDQGSVFNKESMVLFALALFCNTPHKDLRKAARCSVLYSFVRLLFPSHPFIVVY